MALDNIIVFALYSPTGGEDSQARLALEVVRSSLGLSFLVTYAARIFRAISKTYNGWPMCYSARVRQNLKHLSRRYEAEVDWAAFEELYRRRAVGEDIKMSRDLQRNFQNPETDVERRTSEYIAQFLKAKRSEWENGVFAQRRRVAEAEKALAKRETKKAREDIRIGTKKAQEFLDRLADLRRTESNNEDARIFPLSYAPVLMSEEDRRVIKPMRYTCRLAGKPSDAEKRFPGIYNARRDSLDDYWRAVYGRKHAVIVISGFYENVPEHLYQHRELAPDEKEKNLVLEFDPKPARDMLVACLWDHWSQPGKPSLDSFAAITDEPTPEVAATGHQRTIITIQEEDLSAWLRPESQSRDRLGQILSEKDIPYYIHQVAA